MPDIEKIDYSELDVPSILSVLFHPRAEWGGGIPGDWEEIMIPVADNEQIGARFYSAPGPQMPVILFFHGNGEIVEDYDDMGQLYNKIGINFIPVDYRGYGKSTGSPSVTGMMKDCHYIFKYVKDRLIKDGYTLPLLVMGRSLGSASALEIAENYESDIGGLIIESGFAYAAPLLRLLGANIKTTDEGEDELGNHVKLKNFAKPVLVIHAEFDHIIPFSDGQTLYDSCGAADKTLLMIPGANHNDVFFRGMNVYLEGIRDIAQKLLSGAQ